jgi:purine-binding chemotaxis protein CheW
VSQIKVTDGQRFLEFTLGEESYAVELIHVREVITPPELTPIPKAPPHVCGLMNLRGLVLTVVDLRKKLSIQPGKDQTQSSVIIFDLGDRLVGAQVDNIQRVIAVATENIKPVPDADASLVTQNLKGVIQNAGILTLWLDVQRLLSATPQPTSKAA